MKNSTLLGRFGKAITPGFVSTSMHLIDGLMSQLDNAVTNMNENAEANAGLVKQEAKLAHEQRKINLKLSQDEFKIDADLTMAESQLNAAKHSIVMLEKKHTIMVFTLAQLGATNPDKVPAMRTRIAENRAAIDAAKALIEEFTNIEAPVTNETATYGVSLDFDPNDL